MRVLFAPPRPAVAVKKVDDPKLTSLLAIGAVLAPGARSLARGVRVAFEDPARYIEKYDERSERRGIDTPIPCLPWIALFDELCDADEGAEIDWRADAMEVKNALRSLGRLPQGAIRWMGEDLQINEYSTWELLEVAGRHFLKTPVRLASFDMKSDNYCLVLVPAKDVRRLVSAAKAAGFVLEVFVGKHLAEATAARLARQRARGRRVAKVGKRDKPARLVDREDRRVTRLRVYYSKGLADLASRVEHSRERTENGLATRQANVAIGSLTTHASYVARLGMHDVLDGHEEGWDAVSRYAHVHALTAIARPAGVFLPRVGMYLALTMVFAKRALWTRYASTIEKLQASPGPSKLGSYTPVANFVLDLVARSLGKVPKKGREMGEYAAALAAWKKPKALAAAVEEACEYHLEDADASEFSIFMLVPAEIEAMRIVREAAGLSWPAVSHPLLQTNLARFPKETAYRPESDELLQRCLELARQ
jgi:hypothetical protein